MSPEDRLRIYVAGPYTANPEACTARAIQAGSKLLENGMAPFVPHLSHYWEKEHSAFKAHGYEDWMGIDLSWIRAADCVVRLPGKSAGADREVQLATELGIPVIHVGFDFSSAQKPGEIQVANVRKAAQAHRDAKDALAGVWEYANPAITNRVRVPEGHVIVHTNAEQAGVVASPEIPVRQALDMIAAIFEKNADYANEESWRSNFKDVAAQQGMSSDIDACNTLIAVKQARLRSLAKNGTTPKNESVEDTLLDRATYAVIALAMYLEDKETADGTE